MYIVAHKSVILALSVPVVVAGEKGLWSSGAEDRNLQFGRIVRFAGSDVATCNDLIGVFSHCRCCGRSRGTRPRHTREFDSLSLRQQVVANSGVV
jgi:hypothetical protein